MEPIHVLLICFAAIFLVTIGLQELANLEERLEKKQRGGSRDEVQKILEKHKTGLQELMNCTVDKLTRAFDAAMVKKVQRIKEGRSTPHRSIDD